MNAARKKNAIKIFKTSKRLKFGSLVVLEENNWFDQNKTKYKYSFYPSVLPSLNPNKCQCGYIRLSQFYFIRIT